MTQITPESLPTLECMRYTMAVKEASACMPRFFKAETDSRTSHCEAQSCKEEICDFLAGRAPEMRKSDS